MHTVPRHYFPAVYQPARYGDVGSGITVVSYVYLPAPKQDMNEASCAINNGELRQQLTSPLIAAFVLLINVVGDDRAAAALWLCTV